MKIVSTSIKSIHIKMQYAISGAQNAKQAESFVKETIFKTDLQAFAQYAAKAKVKAYAKDSQEQNELVIVEIDA